MSAIDDNLKRLGIELPAPAAPAANYVPFALAGGLLFTSG
ncbi:MAG: RidA family protein, partial [Rhizobiaceae bacterium]